MTATNPAADSTGTDWSWTRADPGWIPPDVDSSRPSVARMQNFAMGGKDNFAVDRKAIAAMAEVFPDYPALALASRAFLIRAVDSMARDGIDQFIDLGTGVPVSPSAHDAARLVHPGARVVYVDNDPIVVAQNRALRGNYPGALIAHHDLRHPASLLADPRIRGWVDFSRPLGLLFTGVLHFVRSDLAPRMLAGYRAALAPGSQVALSVLCADGTPPAVMKRMEEVYSATSVPITFRSAAQIEQLLEGLDVLDPGLTDVTCWRTEGSPATARMLAGLGRSV